MTARLNLMSYPQSGRRLSAVLATACVSSELFLMSAGSTQFRSEQCSWLHISRRCLISCTGAMHFQYWGHAFQDYYSVVQLLMQCGMHVLWPGLRASHHVGSFASLHPATDTTV